jgi:hypothetical protein
MYSRDDHDQRFEQPCGFAGGTSGLPALVREDARSSISILWPHPRAERIYRSFRWGAAVELFLVDARSYRSANDLEDSPGGGKTLLGRAQLDWLKNGLESSNATWKIVSSDVPLSIATGSRAEVFGRDAFADGDSAGGPRTGSETELRELLSHLDREDVSNVVFLVTDVHFASSLRYEIDLDSDGDELLFHELVTGLERGLGAKPPDDVRSAGPLRGRRLQLRFGARRLALRLHEVRDDQAACGARAHDPGGEMTAERRSPPSPLFPARRETIDFEPDFGASFHRRSASSASLGRKPVSRYSAAFSDLFPFPFSRLLEPRSAGRVVLIGPKRSSRAASPVSPVERSRPIKRRDRFEVRAPGALRSLGTLNPRRPTPSRGGGPSTIPGFVLAISQQKSLRFPGLSRGSAPGFLDPPICLSHLARAAISEPPSAGAAFEASSSRRFASPGSRGDLFGILPMGEGPHCRG